MLAVDLTAESLGIDSEHQLFRELPVAISSKIERSVYNRRRCKLFFVKERIRKALSEKLMAQKIISLLTACLWKFVNCHAHQEQKFAKKITLQVPPKDIAPVKI